jgi:hypothetical protein
MKTCFGGRACVCGRELPGCDWLSGTQEDHMWELRLRELWAGGYPITENESYIIPFVNLQNVNTKK